jgi:hypothetical protein
MTFWGFVEGKKVEYLQMVSLKKIAIASYFPINVTKRQRYIIFENIHS